MVLEVIRYLIAQGEETNFERAYSEAARILDASPHCLNYSLARSNREKTRYLLLIEWESAEAHLFAKVWTSPTFTGSSSLITRCSKKWSITN